MKNEREKIMKRIKIVIISILLIISVGMYMQSNKAYAAIDPNVEIKINVLADASVAATRGKVYVHISTTDDMISGIDANSPATITADLSYNTSLLTNPTIEGTNSWTANMNNNKIVMETNNFRLDSEMATITFDVITPVAEDTKTKIEFTNVEIKINNDYNKSYASVATDEFTIRASKTAPTGDEGGSGSGSEGGSGEQGGSGDEGTDLIIDDGSDGGTSTDDGTSTSGGSSSGQGGSGSISDNGIIKDNTTSPKIIPQTGVGMAVFVAIGIAAIIGVYTFIRDKKFYD